MKQIKITEFSKVTNRGIEPNTINYNTVNINIETKIEDENYAKISMNGILIYVKTKKEK